MFLNEQVFVAWQHWLLFSFRGKNIFKEFYQKNSLPDVQNKTCYEEKAINYNDGLIFGGHQNLFRVVG
jgi:hypothetical protein